MFSCGQPPPAASDTVDGMVQHVADDAIRTDAEHERLNWMRAEFRAAQQRRCEKKAIALVNRSLTAKAPEPDVEPPTRATPPRRIPLTGEHT